MCVPVNHTVTLSVRAEGTGLLQYQWFTNEDNVVCEVCGVRACVRVYCFHGLRVFGFHYCADLNCRYCGLDCGLWHSLSGIPFLQKNLLTAVI